MGGYPGPHAMPSMPSGLYPPQASGMGLDLHDGWNHLRAAQDHAMWNPIMEVRRKDYILHSLQLPIIDNE